MQSNPSNVAKAVRNEPHDLLARLYREIGVSAVAVALGISEDPVERSSAPKSRPEAHARQAA